MSKRMSQKEMMKLHWLLDVYKSDHYHTESGNLAEELLYKIEAELGGLHSYKINEMALQAENTRNAGRKPTYSEEIIEKMKNLHNDGMTMTAIAKECNCSIGTVHRYVGSHINYD